jgi:hypothetical protein
MSIEALTDQGQTWSEKIVNKMKTFGRRLVERNILRSKKISFKMKTE